MQIDSSLPAEEKIRSDIRACHYLKPPVPPVSLWRLEASLPRTEGKRDGAKYLPSTVCTDCLFEKKTKGILLSNLPSQESFLFKSLALTWAGGFTFHTLLPLWLL